MPAGEQYTPDEFARHLEEQGRALRSMDWVRSAWPLINKMLESQTRKAFHNQQSPGGVPWPAVNWRANGTSGHALQVTRELMASVTSNAAGAIRVLQGTAIIFGSNSIKTFHNKGGMIQRRASKFLTIPASKEAMYVGGMRNFPRKLNIVWNEAKGKGFAYEKVLNQRPTRRAGRSSRRGRAGRNKSLLGKLLKKAKNAAYGLLRALIAKKKAQKAKKARAKKVKKAKYRVVVHYYLRAFVIVPQRQFLEVTPETTEKAAKILTQQAMKFVKGA